MKRYAIWDKVSPVITPRGEVFTAEQWIARYPVAQLDYIVVVCAAGEINGGYFGTLGQMVQMYANQGCDFSACTTNEEKLEVIEAFETAQNEAAQQAAAEAASTTERQTAALEAIAEGATSDTTAAMDALLMGEEE